MWQAIGAFLDTLLFFGLGFTAWRYAQLLAETDTCGEDDPRKIPLVRVAGPSSWPSELRLLFDLLAV